MLTAQKDTLRSFFDDSKTQYKIPFFQRAYVWKEDNWNDLWEDIIEELEQHKSGNKNSEHFIGTIIVKRTDIGKISPDVLDLIDGQQRLTTVCLILKALHDTSEDNNLKDWIERLLIFRDSYGKKYIRIEHSKVDAEYFGQIIFSNSGNNNLQSPTNKIINCYTFFRKKILEFAICNENIREVIDVILGKLPVIYMALTANDDMQQIFDTINSLGVKLTTGELLKNHLFSFPELINFYKKYWQDIFEIDDDSVIFWEKDKTSGRVKRTTIELFLFSYLIIIEERNVKLEGLFNEYKKYLKDTNTEEKLRFTKELSEYAKIYEQLPDGTELENIEYSEHEKRFFHIINELEINTVFPLVLFIYKNVTENEERIRIMQCLESYIVRRAICKLTTKNYNNLFISIMVDLKKQPDVTGELFKNKLLSYTDETSRFPDDKEFQKCFSRAQLSNKYSKEILYIIALYQQSFKYHDVKKLNFQAYSVEHIMPKKWRNNWQVPTSKKDEEKLDDKILTFGNLTLINGRLNSSLRDANWNKKQKGLEPYSTLGITKNCLHLPIWDDITISVRCEDLFKDAIVIWKRENIFEKENGKLYIPESFNTNKLQKDDDFVKPIKHAEKQKYQNGELNFTYTEPKLLKINGMEHTTKTWKDVLIIILNTLIDKEGGISKLMEEAFIKDKNCKQPKKLKNGIFIETNYDANRIVRYSSFSLEIYKMTAEVEFLQLKTGEMEICQLPTKIK